MSSKEYKKEIIDGLLRKYNIRYAKNITTNRRIILKPTEVYKDYAKNNADILEKQGINEAVSVLNDMGFITVDYLKFSDDIDKVYLLEEKLEALYEYLKEEYSVIPQSTISKRVHEIVEKYIFMGKIVNKYCESILVQIEDPRCTLDPEQIEATSLGVKIDGGIGTAVVGWLLEFSGYVGTHAVQPQSALNMMQFMYLWLPLIFDVLIMFILSRMNVEETNAKIKKEKGITVETAQQ